VASELLDLGLHTHCEKPLALTIRGGSRVIAAERRGKVLSVTEIFRRDPMNRIVRALLDDAAIEQHLGMPQVPIDVAVAQCAALGFDGWSRR
jgi:predicted dehydrogenase